MESAHPRINLDNFMHLHGQAAYAHRARMDLVAAMYLEEYSLDYLNGITFIRVPVDVFGLDPVDRQQFLDQQFREKVDFAIDIWRGSKDDEEWDDRKRDLMLWYQKGLDVLNLVTDQDLEDFVQLYETDKWVRMRYESLGTENRRLP